MEIGRSAQFKCAGKFTQECVPIPIPIRPLAAFPDRGHRSAAANASCHWERGRVRPGQVTRGHQLITGLTYRDKQILTHNLESPINLTVLYSVFGLEEVVAARRRGQNREHTWPLHLHIHYVFYVDSILWKACRHCSHHATWWHKGSDMKNDWAWFWF